MKVLNPLFDTVFKYLLEDLDIAKALIEAVIKKEVKELYPAPQEASDRELKIKYTSIGLIRQDFVAVIKTEKKSGEPEYEKVVIEVQKSPFAPEISRFRNYLSDKYRKKSSVGQEERYLPIKTIYLIEDLFNPNLPAVLGRVGTYYDELEGCPYQGERDSMVELFNHDSWFIQTELLPPEFKDELMYVLSVFAPQYRKNKSDRYIEIPDSEILEKKHRILSLMFRRLEAATGNTEINTTVEMELEYEKYIEDIKQAAQKAEEQSEKDRKAKEEAEIKAEQAELHKKIFRLYFIEKQSINKISKELNISEDFIKTIIS